MPERPCVILLGCGGRQCRCTEGIANSGLNVDETYRKSCRSSLRAGKGAGVGAAACRVVGVWPSMQL